MQQIHFFDINKAQTDAVQKCIEFACKSDLQAIPVGRYEIEGNDIFVCISEYETVPSEEKAWEAHREYIDIQLAISGKEIVEVTPLCEMTRGEYAEEQDFLPCEGEAKHQIILEGNKALILFPEDAHKPGVQCGEKGKVKKAVFKIRYPRWGSAVEDAGVHAEIISPTDGHYFFGYYDLQPFDTTGRYHLCHKAPFEDHEPEPEDICELGMLDLQTKEFIKLAETTAWNFQQGAMLQWYGDDEHIIYNIREGNAYRSCVQNIKTGEKRILPMAIANLSKDCKRAVCVNFSRIYDFRPGYGYKGISDPYKNVKAPKEDGVFVMDTETGECKLVLNYEMIKNAFPQKPYCDEKLLVNHINLNPSGDRFVMLLRNFPEPGSKWATLLLTCDDKGNMHQMAEYATHSHYHWKNDKELLIVSTRTADNRKLGLYRFEDQTENWIHIPEPCPERPIKDIHCLYSQDRKYIMGDGYPDKNSYRWLHFIEADTCKDTVLGKYKSYNFSEEAMEYRCDLHARYDRTGRYVSFDSNHIGNRCVCLLDLNDLKRGY